MLLGLISDLHGDLPSTERALDALDRRGVDKVLCAGDLVERGPRGDEVVALVQRSLIPSVKGNHDENAVRDAQMPSWSEQELQGSTLSPTTLAILDALPDQLEYRWEGVQVVVAHGVPGNNGTSVTADHVPKRLKRILRRTAAEVMILGHSHRPMALLQGGVLIVNPGAVCRLKLRDSHTCAVLSLPDLAFEVIELG